MKNMEQEKLMMNMKNFYQLDGKKKRDKNIIYEGWFAYL